MRSRHLLIVLAAGALCLPACARLNPFHRDKAAVSAEDQTVVGRKKTSRGMSLELRSTPDPLKLGETRQLQVSLVLHNNSKRQVNLKFPHSQCYEIILRDVADNKIVAQWSTDRTFDVGGRQLLVNPQERLEFSEPVTTRELKAGRTYSLEASFVGYDDLRVSRPIIPQP